MLEYGALVDELHIIVFSRKSKVPPKARLVKGGESRKFGNVFLYPTNSRSKWFYIFNARKIARNMFHVSRFTFHDWLVTTQDPFETGLAGWLIARKNNIPLQLQIHTDFLNPCFARESLLNHIRVRIARFLLPRARGIRVVSDRIKNSLKAKSYKLKAEPTVLPIFVDTEQLKNAPVKTDLRKKYPQFDFIVLMASRLTKEKNIPLAFAAMKEIVKKHPRVGLVIVGSGLKEKELKLLTT